MQPANILIVDDDREFLIALSKLLAKNGYSVSGAINPGAAMDFVTSRSRSVDLVITDFSMPVVDGLKLLTAIKAAFPHVPVILITAYGSEETCNQAVAQGAFACLDKPVDKEVLLAVIENALKSAVRPGR
jgi:DNA-binding NtrC family response regulator